MHVLKLYLSIITAFMSAVNILATSTSPPVDERPLLNLSNVNVSLQNLIDLTRFVGRRRPNPLNVQQQQDTNITQEIPTAQSSTLQPSTTTTQPTTEETTTITQFKTTTQERINLVDASQNLDRGNLAIVWVNPPSNIRRRPRDDRRRR